MSLLNQDGVSKIHFNVRGVMMPRHRTENELYKINPISMDAVIEYQKCEIGTPFIIRLKVPLSNSEVYYYLNPKSMIMKF